MTPSFETLASAVNNVNSTNSRYEKPSISFVGSLLELTEGNNASQTSKDALVAGSCAGANTTSNSRRACSL